MSWEQTGGSALHFPHQAGHYPPVRHTGIFLRLLAVITLLGSGVAALADAADSQRAKPRTEKSEGPSAPALEERGIHNLLWLLKVTERQNLDAGLRRLLETLDRSKVPTAEQAKGAALWAKLKAGGLLAEEGARVVGLVRLGVDVPELASSGDLVWVVQIEHMVRGVTQEVWVSSTTGAVRVMLPLEAKPGRK